MNDVKPISARTKLFPCINCGADEVEGMGWICQSDKHHINDGEMSEAGAPK